jgi:hypothetical protein
MQTVHPAEEDRRAEQRRQSSTVNDFCKRHGISRTTFYEEVKDGRLIARKVRGRTTVRDDDEASWLDALPKLDTAHAA